MSDIPVVPDDDLATLLAKREHAKPNKVTWVLLVLLVLTVGFATGALVNQKFGTSSTAGFSGPPAGFTPPGMATTDGTASGTTSGSGAMTVGTVKLVDGANVYVATSDGSVVKVKVPATAAVTVQKDIPLSDLAAGSPVTVQGETGTDGTVTATSVSSQPTTQGAN